MADPIDGGNSGPTQPPKEMSMEVRLLLAFLLMGVVVYLTPYFMKTPPAPPKKTTPVQTSTGQSAPPAAPTPHPTTAAAVPAVKPLPGTEQQPLPTLVIDTDLYRVAFSNQGATVRSWQFKKYKGNDDKPLELMNVAAGLEFPFSLYFPGQQPTAPVNWRYFSQTPDADGLGVAFSFSDGHTVVRKTFRFQKNSYLSEVTAEATLDGNPLPSEIAWRGGFGDLTVTSPASNVRALYFSVADNKLVEQAASAAKKGPVTSTGDFSFAGLADKYFAAVFLAEGSGQVAETTFSDAVPTPLDQNKLPYAGAAVSDGPANRFRLFVGPKDVDLLKRVDPKLEQVVDFGWLSFMAKPLFLLVNWFNQAFVHNFGWSIVLVTIAINFALFPLRLSNMKSMRKMQALKPQIDAINARFKNVGMRDPKKAEQNQEVMDLYKKNGVNPMGGCFPMLIQLPFFIAFYKVFTVSVEMRGANWLWVSDLSQPELSAIKVLPLIMIATQFLMQRMTPQPNTDPGQQKMMMMMPLVFGFMFYNFPSGLVLYYLTSNLVNMGQQWFFNHTEAANAAARSVEPPKKKNGRK